MSIVASRAFSADVLRIQDPEQAITHIADSIREQVLRRLRRRGVVLGLSGGIDSSVTAALCVRALGKDRVLGLLMPEADSDPESLRLAQLLSDSLGKLPTVVEDISPILRSCGCYARRDERIRQVVPDYTPSCKCKINIDQSGTYNVFCIVVQYPDGRVTTTRLPLTPYLGIVAATSFKQRTRKMLEYYHADRLNYAVAGTPNRLEYDQGFFVKNGDGAADLKPIAHLYKTQVYQLAEALAIPDEIRRRPPTTDTYSMAQTQEEFYFALRYDKMDLCLWGLNHDVSAELVAQCLNLAPEQVQQVYRDILAKRRTTSYQHERPLLVEPVTEVGACS
jgi:NAD+ synthase